MFNSNKKLGLFGLLSLIVTLAFIALVMAHQLRGEFAFIATVHEVTCKVDTKRDKAECIELEELSNKLININRKIDTKELALCTVARLIKINSLNSCSNADVAVDLYNEINILVNSMEVLEKHN
ncbi:hypothetical protein WB858_004633 [Vibrio parahaemolyticus]|uniref:Uncharacterized protein n=1 Tax=Vibrio parahaemolyticus TaxID=670 RepID=A0AA46Z4H4_VIBPH|nr:hypothetical protein [Vibrio parahaemolyticus]HAS8445737.1 hypothetical protein [Vibrio vulnificus]MCC3850307.1 hypothetical protein [Vibrio parahaemolyticus]UYV25312.1 hypothetical protein M5598_09615 [Vibrio parahaemolyticus]HAS8454915.1 hypothetical protein [Vibrio vulnificus]HCJ4876930.1 hypothetical protein [Vibrio parahaemolyticus]